MFSANKFAGFFNQQCLRNKLIKLSVFLHGNTISHKLKVHQRILGEHAQKWMWPVWL